MKSDATWADYPVAGGWMAEVAWDHFDYSQDTAWFQSTGYPFLKCCVVLVDPASKKTSISTTELWLSTLATL
jgi:hypothetical protein